MIKVALGWSVKDAVNGTPVEMTSVTGTIEYTLYSGGGPPYGTPVWVGVTVQLLGDVSMSTATNGSGFFTFTNVPVGAHVYVNVPAQLPSGEIAPNQSGQTGTWAANPTYNDIGSLVCARP